MNPLTFVRGVGSVAMKYGVEEAILLDTIVFWARENKSRGENFKDGRWWTYNSIKGLAEIFPWWSQKQLRRILSSCIEQKALLVGNYNREKRDRTIWYSPSDDLLLIYGEDWTGKCICPNGQMEMPEQADGDAQTGTPLPCLNPCGNSMDAPHSPPEGDEPAGKKKRDPAVPKYRPDLFERFWGKYPLREGRRSPRSKAVRAWDKLKPDMELCFAMSAALEPQNWPESWHREDGRYIPLASTWLTDIRENGLELPVKPQAASPPITRPRAYHMEEIDGEEVVVYDS